jgi:outer membrane receptor protein involved in Fe transport
VFYPKATCRTSSPTIVLPKFNFLDQMRLRCVQKSGHPAQRHGDLPTFRPPRQRGTPGSTAGTDKSGLIANALGNADLKPEKSTEAEMGFETRMFTNRVNFDFTYYNKKTQDALVNKPIAPSSGASATSVLTNLASVQNTGIEAVLTTTLLDRRRFGWDVTQSGSHGRTDPQGLWSNGCSSNHHGMRLGGTARKKHQGPAGQWPTTPFTFADPTRRHHHAERSDRRYAQGRRHAARPGRVHGL